ncbi:outer membrane protein assembly factor BamE [Paenibacillus sp. 1P07SE]|uniref:outer membrane protein assembly factor BamE domain-containing protein n=1 Tax=Paenibacillus sp. 1P07SE TaxID=3132209 RepID=UPI0039A6CDD6
MEDRSQSYEADRLAIDGKTYYQWYEELVESPAEVQLPYYTQTGRFDAVRSHDEGGIVSWDLLVAFTTDAYQTSDGVRVGMSKDEVLEALGTPHIQTSIHWRYDIDNWDDLHLYFEGDTVRYVVMTTAD